MSGRPDRRGKLLSRFNLDRGVRDRHGRAVGLTLTGGGRACVLTARGLEAALRLRRQLSARPALCAKAMEKLFGLRPERLEAALWNGKKLVFNTPADTGAFLGDIHGIVLRDQYNAAEVKGGVVADCGANLGVFSLYALALGAVKVYAFEAVAETFAMLEANLALNRCRGRVKAVNVALGAEKGSAELKFNTRGEGSAMIGGADTVNAGISYAASRRVRVAPLDSLVRGRAGFIKIDVEGFEKETLLGAAGLIKRCKPVISMAAYHRASDARTLPAALKAIAPGYRVKLNGYAEQDLYCTP